MRVAHHCECACRIRQARKRLDFGPAIESLEAEPDRYSIWHDGILAPEHLSCDLFGSNTGSCPVAKMAHLQLGHCSELGCCCWRSLTLLSMRKTTDFLAGAVFTTVSACELLLFPWRYGGNHTPRCLKPLQR